jgi:hypothetical protein
MTTNFFRKTGLIAALLFSFQIAQAADGPVRVDKQRLSAFTIDEQSRIQCIAERLEEIAVMDRSELTRAEKKALRNETRELKVQADAFNRAGNGTVIYISGGTLLVIFLLILILS